MASGARSSPPTSTVATPTPTARVSATAAAAAMATAAPALKRWETGKAKRCRSPTVTLTAALRLATALITGTEMGGVATHGAPLTPPQRGGSIRAAAARQLHYAGMARRRGHCSSHGSTERAPSPRPSLVERRTLETKSNPSTI
ncbi:unnamed protein product [Phaeothamnion confervicola]